jgi:hypothetical protein
MPTLEKVTIAGLLVPDEPIYAILTLVSGIFWTIVYIDIIYRGFKDKACGMPLMVLGLNWSWEFIFAFMGDPFFPEGSFFHVTDQTMVQRGVDAVWFLFDCVILYLKIKYGREEYNHALPGFGKKMFIPYVALILFISFQAVWFISIELEDHQGAYAAYQQNIFISSLYIPMLLRRGNTDGQSMVIAISKCLGTLAPDVMGAVVLLKAYHVPWQKFVLMETMPYMKLLIGSCLLFDIVYMITLYRAFKKEGKNPWTRKPLPGYVQSDDPHVWVPEEVAAGIFVKDTPEKYSEEFMAGINAAQKNR